MAAPAQRRRRTEEQQQTPQQRLLEAQRLITQQLVNNGYTQQEAAEAVRLARTMISTTSRAPRPEPLRADNPVHRRLGTHLLEQVRDTMIAAYQSTESTGSVVQGRLYDRPQGAVRVAMVPTPVRQFRYTYDVTVDGQRYTLEANRDLRWSGTITQPGQTRGGRLMAFLDAAQNSDVRITREGSGTASPTVVTRQQLITALRPAYRAIVQEFADAERRGNDPSENILNRIDMTHRQTPRTG